MRNTTQVFEPITQREARDIRRLATDLLSLGKQTLPLAQFKSDKRCQFARYMLAMVKVRNP